MSIPGWIAGALLAWGSLGWLAAILNSSGPGCAP